jgi:putative hemolysin
MEDLVEELIGDIQDEYDVERPVQEQGAFGVRTVDGLLNLDDFEDESGLELPEGPYETVAGFIISRLGRVPLLGDVVTEGEHVYEVVELDGRRVSRVRVTGVPVDVIERVGHGEAADAGSAGDHGRTTE